MEDAAKTPRRKRSHEDISSRLLDCLSCWKQLLVLSEEAEEKLLGFVRQDNITLYSSKDEFVASLKIPGTNNDDIKVAHLLYDKHKQFVEESNQELPCPKTPKTTKDYSEIQRAIGRPFSMEGADIPPHDLLHRTLTHIVDATNELVPEDRNLDGTEPAPFVFLLQSTGYGKTRTVYQLAETYRKVVYLPWKGTMPKVVGKMKQLLKDANTDSRRMLLWDKILEAVQRCADHYPTADNLFEAHKSNEFYTRLEDSLAKAMTPISRMKFEKKDETPLPRPSKTVKLPEKDEGEEVYYYTDAQRPQHSSLVVCLDEVTGLPDEVYRSYRRVAKQRGILSIFSDTATSICKIFPTNDHSQTSHKGKLGHFIKPLFDLQTIDVDLSVDDRLNLPDDDYEGLFCAGRPLWKSRLDELNDVNKLLDHAENLLTQSRDETDEDLQSLSKLDFPILNGPRIVDHNLIAVFVCRFAMGKESRMAPLLVKHSLATVTDVNDDRSKVSSSYPSEPILPEVSARFTNKNGNRRKVLQEIRCAFNNRTKLLEAPKGEVGEMCTAALLGYLMDIIRVSKNHKYMSQPVPLLDLLNYFGAENKNLDSLLGNWEVNFTHFFRPDDIPTDEHFRIMWKRRVAYYVRKGCEGLHLLVVIKDKNGNYGTLRIQVKNQGDKITSRKANPILAKLLPKKCPPKDSKEKLCVGLLLCTGKVDERCDVARYDNGKIIEQHNNDTPIAAKSSSHNQQDCEQQLLQLVSTFPYHHRDKTVRELAALLQDIALTNQKDKPNHTSKRFAKYYSANTGDNEQT